jgi:DNA-binding NarL/FixJ family response regulator
MKTILIFNRIPIIDGFLTKAFLTDPELIKIIVDEFDFYDELGTGKYDIIVICIDHHMRNSVSIVRRIAQLALSSKLVIFGNYQFYQQELSEAGVTIFVSETSPHEAFEAIVQ